MMGNFLREFREFAMKGNVIDMAIGIIIGTAFGKVVTSLVNDVIMPPIGLLIGGMDFSQLFINLSGTPYPSLEEATAAGAPALRYGLFINTVLDFLIVAAAIFLVVRTMNRLRARQEEAPPPPETPPDVKLLSEIRDLLQAGR